MADFSIPFGTVKNGFMNYDPTFSYDWRAEDLASTTTNTLHIDGHLSAVYFDNYVPLVTYPPLDETDVNYVPQVNWVVSLANWAVTVTGSMGYVGDMPVFADVQAMMAAFGGGLISPAGGFYNGAIEGANLLDVASGGSVRGIGFALENIANTRIENSGVIESASLAIVYYDLRNETLPIPDPEVIPFGSTNLTFGNTIAVVNEANGLISGGFTGILNNSFSTLRVVNRGVLVAENTNSFWNDPLDGLNFPFDTSGAIVSLGRVVLTNSGILDGGVKMGWYTNTITNSGVILGSIRSEFDTNANGKVDTNADGDFDDAGDRLFWQLAGTTVTNRGTIVGQTIEVTYIDSEGMLRTGFAQIAIATGGARDTVINHAPSIVIGGDPAGIYGSIDLGHGSDRLENYGLIKGGINMGDSSDTAINGANGVIIGDVHLGNGNDNLTNAGFIDAIYEHGPQVSLTVDAGDGNDVLVNTATGLIGAPGVDDPNFVLGNPLTFINASGSNYFSPGNIVDMGAGNDSVTNEGMIWGVVDLGAGNDTYTGGNRFDLAANGDGRDSYNLGGDGDVFYMRGEDGDVDTIMGGAGIDLIFLQDFDTYDGATSGTMINLTKGIMRTGDLGARTDIITGFEQVVGSNGDDNIIGSFNAETLMGGAGDDTIIGSGGKDLLFGSYGLLGGYGADDFVFNRATDSKAGWSRDVIVGFDNTDQLVFNFDTNTTLDGVQSGVLDLDDVLYVPLSDFSGAGSYRLNSLATPSVDLPPQGYHFLLELDMNGDNRADFAIEFAFYWPD